MVLTRVRSVIFGAGLLWGAVAAPAWSHVSVGAEPAQPGADAIVSFTAESESDRAGITRLEIVAEPALPGDEVEFAEGPAGWTTVPGPEGGLVFEGPALPAGRDIRVAIQVRHLPDSPRVLFRVIQSYSDGRVDRWIDAAGTGGTEPEFPAPVLELGAPPTAGPTLQAGAPQHHGDEAIPGSLARTATGSRSLAGAGLLFVAAGAITLSGAVRPYRWTTGAGSFPRARPARRG